MKEPVGNDPCVVPFLFCCNPAERHMGRSLQGGVMVMPVARSVLFVFLVSRVPLVTSNHFHPGQKLGKPNLGVRNRSTSLAARFCLLQNGYTKIALTKKFVLKTPLLKVQGVLRTFFQEGSKWVWAKPKVFLLGNAQYLSLHSSTGSDQSSSLPQAPSACAASASSIGRLINAKLPGRVT